MSTEALPLFAACGETQRERVLTVLLQQEWATLGEIKAEIYRTFSRIDSEAGISARIRELPHDKRVRTQYRSLWEYRLTTARSE